MYPGALPLSFPRCGGGQIFGERCPARLVYLMNARPVRELVSKKGGGGVAPKTTAKVVLRTAFACVYRCTCTHIILVFILEFYKGFILKFERKSGQFLHHIPLLWLRIHVL